MIDNLTMAINGLTVLKLATVSVDEILLPLYMNESTDFKGLPFKGEMKLS